MIETQESMQSFILAKREKTPRTPWFRKQYPKRVEIFNLIRSEGSEEQKEELARKKELGATIVEARYGLLLTRKNIGRLTGIHEGILTFVERGLGTAEETDLTVKALMETPLAACLTAYQTKMQQAQR